MSLLPTTDERSALTTGCAMSVGSALVTCVLLFVNGSLVLAVLTAVQAGASWAARPEFSQFMLFLAPVVLTVAEWMIIDFVRSRLRSRFPE
jgi:hypothetical protein